MPLIIFLGRNILFSAKSTEYIPVATLNNLGQRHLSLLIKTSTIHVFFISVLCVYMATSSLVGFLFEENLSCVVNTFLFWSLSSSPRTILPAGLVSSSPTQTFTFSFFPTRSYPFLWTRLRLKSIDFIRES